MSHIAHTVSEQLWRIESPILINIIFRYRSSILCKKNFWLICITLKGNVSCFKNLLQNPFIKNLGGGKTFLFTPRIAYIIRRAPAKDIPFYLIIWYIEKQFLLCSNRTNSWFRAQLYCLTFSSFVSFIEDRYQ